MDQGDNSGPATDEGNPGNVYSLFIMPMSQLVDYYHLLYSSLADVSRVNLISFQLLGIKNYAMWSRLIKFALLERNMI